MMKNKLATLLTAAALSAAAAGCATETGTNTNTTTANTSNTTTVVNNNGNANTSGVTTTNTSTTTNGNTTANSNGGRIINANISREEYEKKKDEYAQEAKGLGRKIGAGASDGWLWTKTRASLLGAEDLRDSTINVDVENGVVTLSRTVADAAQRTKAEQVAKGVEGVKSVTNGLKVSAEGGGNSNAGGNNNAGAKKG